MSTNSKDGDNPPISPRRLRSASSVRNNPPTTTAATQESGAQHKRAWGTRRIAAVQVIRPNSTVVPVVPVVPEPSTSRDDRQGAPPRAPKVKVPAPLNRPYYERGVKKTISYANIPDQKK